MPHKQDPSLTTTAGDRKLQVVEEDNSGESHANLGRFCLLVRSYRAYTQRIGAGKTMRTVHFLHRSELVVPFLLNFANVDGGIVDP